MTRKNQYVLIFSAVIAILVLTIFLIGRHDPVYPDDDLKLTRQAIPEKENAVYYFQQAAAILNPDYREPTKTMTVEVQANEDEIKSLTDTTDWKPERGKKLLEKNKDVLELFERGMACRYLQFPKPDSLDSDPLYSPLRTCARLIGVRARYLFKTGHEKAALDETIRIIELGQRMEEGRGSIISFLVAEAVKTFGMVQFQNILERTTLPPETLLPYISRFEAFRVSEKGWSDTLKAEYEMNCFIIDSEFMKKSGMAEMPKFFYQPNHTKQLFAGSYRSILGNAGKPFSEMAKIDIPTYSNFPSQAVLMMSGNSTGKRLWATILRSLEQYEKVKCRTNSCVSATQVLIALRSYKSKTGRLPDSLDALVPEYFKAVPLDDFDGKPLRYSAAKKIVYSVGDDLKDAGRGINDNMKEPTYKIKF